MVRLLLLLTMLACSASPEPVESQTEHWFNTCSLTPVENNIPACSTLYHFTCKDGDSQYLWIPAEGSNWLGTTCYQDSTGSYVYVCVDDTTTGKAEVRCGK